MTKAKELEAAGQTGPSAELARRSIGRIDGLVLHAAASLVVLLILIVMIWKPGA